MSCSIKDVARKAGVSVGTVSRVINGYDNIAPERIDAVREAIRVLGYRKNSVAQLLAGRRGDSRLRTGNIGLWMAEMGNEWSSNSVYINYLTGIEEVCARCGYHVLLEHSCAMDEIPRCVHEGKVDGLIVKALNEIPPVLNELARQLPVIGLSMLEREIPIAQVSTDNQRAGEEVCRYLWDKGHRRIGFVSRNNLHRMFLARLHGYEEFLRRRNAFDPELVQCLPPVSDPREPEKAFPDMGDSLEALLRLAEPPTAIIAANDWMAAGLYEAAERRNLRIPDDISIIGFDHLANLFLRPRLTSYEIPMRGMGAAAAEWIIDLVEHGSSVEEPTFRMVSGTIAVHDSVKDTTT